VATSGEYKEIKHYRHYSRGLSGTWRPLVTDLNFVLLAFQTCTAADARSRLH